ncbi:hypothetical protein KWE42_04440 [Acinetobacter pittii]|uniref:Uncharacterized protein n=2 Tax=Acinetobacter calcoaceticus/baumannii complex TaxID=909768 RepID=A0A241ZCY1_ACIBA|nr:MULTISPECIES: hypothetical protein [Acinetobacter calcoaceticus/baumannii complex]AZP28940.1 hypothetical protein DLK06_07590 [Acinetobacter pittii]MCE5999346.1 hypothetical protein [Acinetobacter pittii]MDR8285244.1 hypothetical protein [Acinetobacter baumannii]MDU0262708.1 hypothetical protein [Acinetobacter baumannii]MDU0283275.1 hypothetical protein [Acinetobacter baumannii]
MKTMRLSDSEAQIILERRAEQHHKKATFAFQVKSIQVANAYFEWAKKNSFLEPTFGTFVNSFCYEGDDKQLMQKAVLEIWHLVFSLQIPMEKPQC